MGAIVWMSKGKPMPELLTKAILSALSAIGIVLCVLAFRSFVRDVFRLVRETCREDGEAD